MLFTAEGFCHDRARLQPPRANVAVHELDDAQLIQRVRAGDRQAFASLYDRHAPMCYGVILRILKSESDAEEVLQEAWVYAWRQLGEFDAQRAQLSTWLVMIARSRALDRLRANRARGVREENAQAGAAPSAPSTPADHAEQDELTREMRGALASLTDNQREALELAFFQGLSHAQVAERVGAPLGTVKSRIRDGLRSLGRLLPKEEWT